MAKPAGADESASYADVSDETVNPATAGVRRNRIRSTDASGRDSVAGIDWRMVRRRTTKQTVYRSFSEPETGGEGASGEHGGLQH
jgi:hypothetical protein